jgi:hypothetical protein
MADDSDVKGVYICEHCQEPFEYVNSDEEALASSESLFGPIDPNDRAIICDDCFREYLPWAARKGLVRH